MRDSLNDKFVENNLIGISIEVTKNEDWVNN